MEERILVFWVVGRLPVCLLRAFRDSATPELLNSRIKNDFSSTTLTTNH